MIGLGFALIPLFFFLCLKFIIRKDYECVWL